MYKVTINLTKYLALIFFLLWGFALVLEFAVFLSSVVFSSDWNDLVLGFFNARKGALVFGLVVGLWFPFQFTLMLTLFGAVLLISLGCTLTTEGVEYSRALIFRQTMLWSDVDSVRSQWGYFVLCKRLPDEMWTDMERVNNVWGSKVCCLPKASLVKDREGFLAYLNEALPAGSVLRSCHFPG